jgi:hypothetical protein
MMPKCLVITPLHDEFSLPKTTTHISIKIVVVVVTWRFAYQLAARVLAAPPLLLSPIISSSSVEIKVVASGADFWRRDPYFF